LIDAANKVCIRQTSTPTLGRMKAEATSLTIAERMQARNRTDWNETGNTFRQNSGTGFGDRRLIL
jgi:hypothetical protein